MAIKHLQHKFENLRLKHKQFIYRGFHYKITKEALFMEFDFEIDDFVEFHPKLNIPNKEFVDFHSISVSMLEQLIFNIGMVELISYWKVICPKEVYIQAFHLTADQIKFWKKIYYHGLGEFFFLNGIEISQNDFMAIDSNPQGITMHAETIKVEELALIPVGGGKDSVVSMEVLKSEGTNIALIMNPRGASIATANIAGFENKMLIINRTLDAKLLELNAKGYLNGHTPFSALLAFVSFLAAAISHKKYIALSNESSANESTVIGTKINHQYSKSLEFESDFRKYSHKYLSHDINYFSLLRPLSELQIASIFAKNSAYFMDFKSCNVGSKTNSWCGKCSKCLFTFIILSPFVSPEVLADIFGANLLDDKELLSYFDELTGIAELKPFECVGTVDEVNIALCLSKEFYRDKLPYLLEYYFKKLPPDNCEKANNIQLSSIDEQANFLDPVFLEKLKNKLWE